MFRSLMPFRRGELTRQDDPFMAFQREMGRMFEDAFRGFPARAGSGEAAFLAPSVDVKETDKALELTAELPGVDEKDVQVTLEDNILTIKGEKRTEKDETKSGYHLAERSYGAFQRAFEVPANVAADKVAASFAKGVLKVTLPKSDDTQAKARRIDVKGT